MKKLWFILGGSLLLLMSIYQSVSCAADIADSVQQYYDSLFSLEAKFEQILKHKESGATEQRKGKLFFKKPLQIRWETQVPNKEQWIVSEKDIWDFLPEEEVAYRYSAESLKTSGGVIGVLLGQTPLKRDFSIKNVGDDGAFTVLQLLPNEPSIQLVEALIWVKSDGGISKMASTDFYGNVNEIRLLDVKKNSEIKNTVFMFQPPKGIDVEDLRKSDLQKNMFQ